MPTNKQVWQLIKQDDCAFSINLKDVYLYIPNGKHNHHVQWNNSQEQNSELTGDKLSSCQQHGFLRPKENVSLNKY